MATVEEARTWLAGRLSSRLGAVVQATENYPETLILAMDELFLVAPHPLVGGRTYNTIYLSTLAEMYQPYLPAALPAGQLAQADFDTLRAAVDPVHQAFLDGCRAEGLI